MIRKIRISGVHAKWPPLCTPFLIHPQVETERSVQPRSWTPFLSEIARDLGDRWWPKRIQQQNCRANPSIQFGPGRFFHDTGRAAKYKE
jgi:hypothetical protein